MGDLAAYTMLIRADAKGDYSFTADICDSLCNLNDNDMINKVERRMAAFKFAELITNKYYPEIRQRKKRMMKNVVEVPEDDAAISDKT